MRISKIRINNFANFSGFEIETGDNLVVVGENKVGKSNLIFALQLILDPGLADRDRQLGLEHFWDGLGDDKLGAVIEIAIEFTDFEHDPRLLAHLGDCIIDPGPPMVSRLTYRFQPKAGLGGQPRSIADYEYILFGGIDPDNAMRPGLRRMLPLDVLAALRDAEKDLATWRRSPLRPLIEALAAGLDETDRDAIQEAVDTAPRPTLQQVSSCARAPQSRPTRASSSVFARVRGSFAKSLPSSKFTPDRWQRRST
jgi:putative ATP-dependent endonuclease of OLD family